MSIRQGVVAMLLGCAVSATANEPAFDVCEQQVRTHATTELGVAITAIEFLWSALPGEGEVEEPSYARVRVSQCDGFHLYEIFATGETCTVLPHYGTPPDYLLYRGGIDGC